MQEVRNKDSYVCKYLEDIRSVSSQPQPCPTECFHANSAFNYLSVLGHFTAMVWKSSKELGVGKATASDGSTFVVARYFPAGNITNQGHFENNVLPAKTTS